MAEETETVETSEMDEKYREAARAAYGENVDVDGDAIVSYSSDGGAYVAAWVWVACDAVGLTEEENEVYV